MKKHIKALVSLFVIPLVMQSAPVLADLLGNVSATSNYVWRGQTQTANTSAVQGGVDYGAPFGLYVGTWVSNTALGSQELDIYGGWAGKLGPVGLDAGAVRYYYPELNSVDWTELYVGADIDVGPVNVSAKISGSDDAIATGENGIYAEAGASMDIVSDLSVGVHAGVYDFDKKAGLSDLTDVSVSITKGEFTFAYIDTDADGVDYTSDQDARIVITWAKEFDLLK